MVLQDVTAKGTMTLRTARASRSRGLPIWLGGVCIVACIILCTTVSYQTAKPLQPADVTRLTEMPYNLSLQYDAHRQVTAGAAGAEAACLPETRAWLHKWLKSELSGIFSLLQSLVESFEALTQPDESDSASTCPLAQKSRLVNYSGGKFVQYGLYFDESAQRFWTKQRRLHSPDTQAVWLPELQPGDCLVCRDSSQCTNAASNRTHLHSSTLHKPDEWGLLHVHESMGQAFHDETTHQVENRQNECEQICSKADEELIDFKENAVARFSCQACKALDVQVDAFVDIRLGNHGVPAYNSAKLSKIDKTLSSLLQHMLIPIRQWTAIVPPWCMTLRAFFLDWTRELADVAQVLNTTLKDPEQLRYMFTNCCRHSHQHSKPEHGVSATTAARHRCPSSVSSDSYVDMDDIHHVLDTIAAIAPDQLGENMQLHLNGGGGGGMGFQLLCLTEGERLDSSESLPLLSIGGGGGGGYRLHHEPSHGKSTFKSGAGGGAGLQSWNVQISADKHNITAADGISVGGGGGGRLHLLFSKESPQSSNPHLDDGVQLISHTHRSSPDDFTSLPPAHSLDHQSTLAAFPSRLAFEMRRCMSKSASRLILTSGGDTGGGVDLTIDNGVKILPAVKLLRHSMAFQMRYEFNTCVQGLHHSHPRFRATDVPCAERRPYP